MIQHRPKEWTKSTRAGDLNCNLLHAHFIDHSYDRHMHTGYAIGVVTHGVEKFWCEGTIFHAAAGSIVSVNPYDVHDGCAGVDAGFVYRMFYFSTEDYSQLLSEIAQKDVAAPRFVNMLENDPELFQQMLNLHSVLQHEPDPLLRRETWVKTLYALAVRHGQFSPATPTRRTDTPASRRMQEYLHDNLMIPVTLEELAQTAGLSTFQAIRKFKTSFGMTPHRYLTNIRLFKAQNLLLDGTPLADVAMACGFADQAHLTRWYKRIYGITPGKFAASNSPVRNIVQDDTTKTP